MTLQIGLYAAIYFDQKVISNMAKDIAKSDDNIFLGGYSSLNKNTASYSWLHHYGAYQPTPIK